MQNKQVNISEKLNSNIMFDNEIIQRLQKQAKAAYSSNPHIQCGYSRMHNRHNRS